MPEYPMKLSHISMIVRDMDKAIEVYCGHLGMQLLRRGAGVAYSEVAMLEDRLSGHRIELLLEKSGGAARLDHIAYEVEDVDSAFERLIREGFSTVRPPFDVPGGSVRTSFVQAPDGVKVEIIRYAKKSE